MQAPSPTLETLLAERAITRVMFDYARGCDRADEAMLRGCFWPEAMVTYGSFDGLARDYVSYAMTIVGALICGAHHISNIYIETHGDAAVAESHYLAHHLRRAADGALDENAFFEGRYIDRFERRDGVWKLAHRRGLRDFNFVMPGRSRADIPDGQHSERAPLDAFYRVFDAFRVRPDAG
ncbi:MAG: nuclear transport factor 2 family protein [Hyphomonadaceae bacterium]